MAGYAFTGAGIGAISAGAGEAVLGATAKLGAVASGAAAGATAGAISGGYMSALAGGSFGRGFSQGAMYGAISGGIFAGAGELLGQAALDRYMNNPDYMLASGGGTGGDPITKTVDLAGVTVYGTRPVPMPRVTMPRIPWEAGLRLAGNTLKALATVPLMTLAFVLSPTQLGPASRPNVMSEGKFKGGKQGQRDNDYGYFKDKAFKDWWHRSGKKKWGGQDFNEGNAEEIYQEWLDLGKPRGGGNKTKHK